MKCHVSAHRLACPPCQRCGALSVAGLVINPPLVAVIVVLLSFSSLPTHCCHCPPPLSIIIIPHECPQRWCKLCSPLLSAFVWSFTIASPSLSSSSWPPSRWFYCRRHCRHSHCCCAVPPGETNKRQCPCCHLRRVLGGWWILSITWEAWHCINYGKINVRKCNWGNSTSSPPMLGKGGRSELTRRADKRDGRAVVRAVLVEILRFEQRDWRSAGATHQIRKNWVSCNSLSRILLGDTSGSPWFGPQQAMGLDEWLMLNSYFDFGRSLWHLKNNWKKPSLSQLLGSSTAMFLVVATLWCSKFPKIA